MYSKLLDGFKMLSDDEIVTYEEMHEDGEVDGYLHMGAFSSIADTPNRTHDCISHSIRNTLVFRNG